MAIVLGDIRLSTDDLVEHLAIAHRSKFALHQLKKLGMEAIPALKKGLCHENPNVRIGCCRVLDQFLEITRFYFTRFCFNYQKNTRLKFSRF